MARTYRRITNGVERTWTGVVEGRDLVVTTTQGRRERVRRTSFPSAEVALAELDAALEQMRQAGWEEVVHELVVEPGAVDPADLPSMLVLADHLTEAGDPRGELIVVQARLESVPTEELAHREAELLAKHDWTGGLPDGVRLGWRRGYVASVQAEGTDGAELAGFLEGLVERGSARFLRELVARGAQSREAVAEVLAFRAWPWLVHLELEGIGALRRPIDQLIRGMPALEHLALRFGTVRSGGFGSGRLRSLELSVQELKLEDLSGLSLDGLRRLSLGVREPWEADRGALQRLVRGVPRLVFAGGAVTEWLEGLSRPPGAERVELRDCLRAGDVGWLLDERRDVLVGVPLTIEGIELSDVDIGRLDGLWLTLPVPDVAVQRGVDRTSRRQETWRRFERAAKGRFWTIVREGSTVLVRYGKVGRDGRLVRSSFDSTRAAAAAYRQRVNRKLAEGWEEVAG